MNPFKSRPTKIKTGSQGEILAQSYLKKLGFRIIDENYRTRWGEIDIIARDGKTIVFIEVKTRTQRMFGSPLQAVTAEKQRRIIRMAKIYLLKKRFQDIPVRFDVIGIEIKEGTPPRIEWIPNAFGGL